MNFVKKIFFINFVVFLFLHVLVPHVHHSEMIYEEHNRVHRNANGIIDLIGLAFHNGSADASKVLIFFKGNSRKKVNFNDLNYFANSCPPTNKIHSKYSVCFVKFQPHKLFNNFHVLFSGLRGPPIV